MDTNNRVTTFGYDAAGNTTSDTYYAYTWDGESQLKTAGGVTYTYDGDGRRVSKIGSKLYWYGAGSEILAETDASGNTLNEYVFFGGKRVALLPAGSTAQFYVEDFLGSSRIVTTNTGVVCYDADFGPYGLERTITNTCLQNSYKFEGKERDAETGNDDFGARYYSYRFGRWLSADWSNVPAPVPYANLTNPQTLNLYSMVADDPESFADLDGHTAGEWVDPHRCALGIPDNPDPNEDPFQSEQESLRQSAAQSQSGQVQQSVQNAGQGQSAAQQRNEDIQAARQYLSGSAEMRSVMAAFDSGHIHIKIIHDGNDRYDPNTRTVYWDPHSALRTTTGGHQTPALGLGHEMAHATGNHRQYDTLSSRPDARYANKEERRVIRNYENPAARQLGESLRYNHAGTTYNVNCPTCR